MTVYSRREFLRSVPALAALGLGIGCSRLPMQEHAALGSPRRLTTRPRVGILWTGNPGPTFSQFRQMLRDRGHIDGSDITIEARFAPADQQSLLPSLADELVHLPVDVIVANGHAAIEAAQHATRAIPIVMLGGSAVVETGLVASMGRPGGNLTGVSLPAALGGKRLELLSQMVGDATRVAGLWIPTVEGRFTIESAQAAAQALGIEFRLLALTTPVELEQAFDDARSWNADAVLLHDSPAFAFHRPRIIRLAATRQLPALYGSRNFVDEGGLMAYGANLLDHFGRAAACVDKILRGGRPGDIPVEQPTVFDLVLNARAAQIHGLTIPSLLVQQATAVL